ncbi:hypothetical protein B0G84_5752 [Paraburkholderia sp. BL8N3]|nr:hypothetical protein [Paraburkholderia sp. BL8N3]TCK36739.1 hypothetical protein B0G84_5752 [Paraburkholderia sp. BL8N3]
MFQTDQSTAVATLPTPAAQGTPGYFTNGNPGAGVPPTILDADFMNMLMMEILNVITAAGLTPSKTSYNQLLAAIRSVGVLVTAQSLLSPGYIRLGSGFILEWGSAITSGSADVAVIYPLAYPTTQLVTLATAQLTTTGAFVGINTPTVNGFNVNGWSASAARAVVGANWLSIGK